MLLIPHSKLGDLRYKCSTTNSVHLQYSRRRSKLGDLTQVWLQQIPEQPYPQCKCLQYSHRLSKHTFLKDTSYPTKCQLQLHSYWFIGHCTVSVHVICFAILFLSSYISLQSDLSPSFERKGTPQILFTTIILEPFRVFTTM